MIRADIFAWANLEPGMSACLSRVDEKRRGHLSALTDAARDAL
jgi:hypothetical protein